MGGAVAGGMDELQKKPIILGLAPNSPLRLASSDLDIVQKFVGYKLPMALINWTFWSELGCGLKRIRL